MNPRIPHLKWSRAPQLYQLTCEIEVSITLRCLLCSTRYTAFRTRTVRKAPLQCTHIPKERNGAARPRYINCRLKSKVSITLRCLLCSSHYSTSAIKIATTKNTDDFRYKGKPSRATTNRHFSLSAKMNGAQRRLLVSP